MEAINNNFKWAEATGEAKFIADRSYPNLLHARFFRSSCPRGRIRELNAPPLPEGYAFFSAKDIPGDNVIPNVRTDMPAFAEDEVRYVGQPIGLLVGPDLKVIDQLLSQIQVDYQPQPPILTLDDAMAQQYPTILEDGNLFDHNQINKGDLDAGWAQATTIVEETLNTGHQEHTYLETQGLVGYIEDGKVTIEGTMQCPWYVHHTMHTVLASDDVQVRQCPTGGAFGGKEDWPDVLAGPLAVAVNALKQPVRLILDRQEDIACTSKRHPLRIHYRTGLNDDGKIVAMEINVEVNGGAYFTLSGIVLQRSMSTATNVYDIPNVQVKGRAWALNTVPNGAFRGFGAPQNCFAMETHMSHLAKKVGQDPVAFKQAHLLNSDSTSLTGAPMHQNLVLETMLEKITRSSGYLQKRASFGKAGDNQKLRGIGMALFQHGCGFAGDLEDTLVKAKVRLLKNSDDTLHIHASNTDIGQGLSLTFRKIVSRTLNVPLETVNYYHPDTGIVPDSGPTVASRSIVIVGYLLEKAAKKMKQNWCSGLAQCIEEVYEKPDYHNWDQEKFIGNAYQVTSYGINALEVEIDPVTFEIKIVDAWGVFDIGKAIDPDVFKGQIDGGMVQAMGYGSLEKLQLTADGRFAQTTMADYTIPTSMDVPHIHSELVDNPYDYGPLGAKGGGELTHNGAAAALVNAVEHALGRSIQAIPVTPESLMEACYEA